MKEYKNIVTINQKTYAVLSPNIRRNINRSSLFDDPELRSIQSIIHKKFRERNLQETSELNRFFLKTSIETEFRIDLLFSDTPIETILYYATQCMEVKSFKQNDYLYLSGDKSDMLYLVVKGEVSLNKIDMNEAYMTMEEYYAYIKEEIRNKLEHMLVMNIIDTNSNMFPLRRFNDLNDIDGIIFLIKLTMTSNELSTPTVDKIKLIYQQYKKDFTLYHFDLVIKGDKDFKRFHSDLTEKVTERERFYSYIMQSTNYEAMPVMKMSYTTIRTVTPFGYFGNFKVWNMDTNIREETAKCESDVSVICFSKKVAGSCIQNDQKQLKEKEVEKVHQLYFFREISKSHFYHLYYGFDLKEYNRGQVLYDAEEKLNCFYIVKEGLIDVSLKNVSLLELDQTLEALKQCEGRHHSVEEEYIMNHPYSLVERYLNKKRTYNVFGSSKKLMFGDWEWYYNHKMSPFTATVTSDKAIVYMYRFPDFEAETEDRVLINEALKQQADVKLSLILERLRTIRYSFYKKIDTEIKRKLKDEELSPPKRYSEAFSLKSIVNAKLDSHKMTKRIAIELEKDKEACIVSYKKDKSKETLPEVKENPEQGIKSPIIESIDLKLITSFHSYSKVKKKQQKRYFLPPIHLDLSEETSKKAQHSLRNYCHTEQSNLSSKPKAKMKVMLPLSTVQNVSLINKLKHPPVYTSRNIDLSSSVNIESLSKSIQKKNLSNEQKVNQSLKNIPGAYYVAVQHLIAK